MKKLRKWLLRGLAGFLIVAGLLYLLRGHIVCAVMQHRITQQTGLRSEIRKVDFQFGSGSISIEGLKIYNPPEFGDEPFIDLPLIQLEYDPASFQNRELRFKKVRFHLASLTIVRTTNGLTNLDHLKGRTTSKASTQKSSSPGGFKFKGIESLELTLGKIRLITLGTTNSITETDLQVRNAVLRNIKTQEELYSGLIEILLLRGGDYSEGPMNELLKQGGSIPPSATNASENLSPPNDVRR